MQKERTIAPDALHRVWTVLRQLNDHESKFDESISDLVTTCFEIRERETVAESTFSDLTKRRLPVGIIEEIASSPKEIGVLLLERAIANISRDYREPNNGFILGYLVNLLGNSLDYADILFPFLEHSNDALLWYGVCVGLRAPEALVGKIGGIARRILRDIESSFCLFDAPDSDLSAEELLMLLRSETAPRFARTNFNSLKVDLLPGVSTTVSWETKESIALPTVRKKPELTEQLQLPIASLQTNDQLVSVLHDIQLKLERINSSQILESLSQIQMHMDSRFDQIEQQVVKPDKSILQDESSASKTPAKPVTKAVSLNQLKQNRSKKKANKRK